MLRLLAEQYGWVMLGLSGTLLERAGPSRRRSWRAGWLRQLRDLVIAGDSETVLVLCKALKRICMLLATR